MATKARDDGLVNIVDHITKLIFDEIIDSWLVKDIKCTSYKNIVKKKYTYFMGREFGLLWSENKRQMNNLLSSVFVKLNKRIRAKQNYERDKLYLEIKHALVEMEEEKFLTEMQEMLLGVNHHICPIDGYPEMQSTE